MLHRRSMVEGFPAPPHAHVLSTHTFKWSRYTGSTSLSLSSLETSNSSQGTSGTTVSLGSMRYLMTHLKVMKVTLTHPERVSRLKTATGVHAVISVE